MTILTNNNNKSAVVGQTEVQLKAFFQNHDTNRDGQLSKEELEKAYEELGSIVPGWRALRSVHHADANKDGRLSWNELEELVKYAVKHGFARA